MKFAKRLNIFEEYVFVGLAKKKKEVEKVSGRRVLDLSIGSPDFPPSNIYIEKMKSFFEEEKSHLYPGYGAIPEFALAIKNWYKKRFNVKLESDEILPLLGAKDGVAHLPLALLDEGDEVLVPDPGYPGFSGPAKLIGAKPVYYKDLSELESKVSKKTRFVWVNFPTNPTGQTVTKKELKKIVDFAICHNIWLVYDNAYSEITFDGYKAPSILEVPGALDVAVEIASFSKTFSFAGDRMGWIVGNKNVVGALAKIKSQYDSGLSLSLQKLGAYALNNFDEKWHRLMIKSYEKRRDTIIKGLKNIGLTAEKVKGGLYLWVKIPDGYKNSEEYVSELLEKKQVLLTPGTAFGKNGKRHVRVSICVNIDGIEKYL